MSRSFIPHHAVERAAGAACRVGTAIISAEMRTPPVAGATPSPLRGEGYKIVPAAEN